MVGTGWVQILVAVATSAVTLAFTYGMLRASVTAIKEDVDELVKMFRNHREDFFALREEVHVNQARARMPGHHNGRDE